MAAVTRMAPKGTPTDTAAATVEAMAAAMAEEEEEQEVVVTGWPTLVQT